MLGKLVAQANTNQLLINLCINYSESMLNIIPHPAYELALDGLEVALKISPNNLDLFLKKAEVFKLVSTYLSLMLA